MHVWPSTGMRLPMTWRAFLAALITFLPAWIGRADAQDDWIGIPLSRASIIETFVQNYLLGLDDDGGQFVLDFAEDGGVKIRLQDGRSLSGRWRAEGNTACVTWNDTTVEACLEVYLAGDTVNFTTTEQQVVRSTRLRHDPPAWYTP